MTSVSAGRFEAKPDYRLVLYYKGDISALTLFVQQNSGSVCFPTKLPALSDIPDGAGAAPPDKVSIHPASMLLQINQLMRLDNNLLELEPDFREQIDTPSGMIDVYLARFRLLDPPHQLMYSRGCRLRTLPELRGRPPTELELLRRAYVKVMEG